MRPRKPKESRAGPAPALVMRLYVTGNAPNSVRALANLAAICKEYLEDRFKLEVIDVLQNPLRALADGILVTPSLTKVSPSPAAKIVGNLGEKSNVLHALGIEA